MADGDRTSECCGATPAIETAELGGVTFYFVGYSYGSSKASEQAFAAVERHRRRGENMTGWRLHTSDDDETFYVIVVSEELVPVRRLAAEIADGGVRWRPDAESLQALLARRIRNSAEGDASWRARYPGAVLDPSGEIKIQPGRG